MRTNPLRDESGRFFVFDLGKNGLHQRFRLRFLAILGVCVISASLSAAEPAQTYRYRQAGWGGPVVVFENGLGDRLETWRSVQDDVSHYSETFSYNRAGYAGSPPALGTRDAATVVGELRALVGGSGHFLQYQKPQVVSAAVREIVVTLREQSVKK